jgi:hypothetical protein
VCIASGFFSSGGLEAFSFSLLKKFICLSSIDLYDLVHGGGKERQYVLCSLSYVDHGYLGEFAEILRLCC